MRLFDTLRRWARAIRDDVMTLWFAGRHPDTPWTAKALGAFVLAYALSPIDLIPDFIPVLGFLDELLLLPGLIWLALRLLPAAVRAESRQRAQTWAAEASHRPRSHWGTVGAIGVVVVWLLLAAAAAVWLLDGA